MKPCKKQAVLFLTRLNVSFTMIFTVNTITSLTR